MSEEPKLKEGWSYLINYPKKWHYFREGRSLCRRYIGLGLSHFEQGNDKSPDNCRACISALEKEREKQSKQIDKAIDLADKVSKEGAKLSATLKKPEKKETA